MSDFDRIVAKLQADLKPVRPIASTRVQTLRLLLAFAVVAVLGAAVLGVHGPRIAWLVFAEVFFLAGATSMVAADSMAPGRPRRVAAPTLALAACVVVSSAFVMLFPDHEPGDFVPEGVKCLVAGLGCSIPAAAGAWLVLRRGYALDRRDAAIAIGTFSGLTGLASLELHCPSTRLPHLIVWHLAVIAIAPLAGYFFASNRKDSEWTQ